MRKPPNPKTSKKSNPTQTPSFCLLSIPNMSKRTFQQLSDESADLSMPTRRMTRSNSSSNPNSFTYYPVVEDTSSRKKRRTQQSNTGSPSKQVLTSSKSKKQGYFPERLYSVRKKFSCKITHTLFFFLRSSKRNIVVIALGVSHTFPQRSNNFPNQHPMSLHPMAYPWIVTN
eukprot:TRINITY_DN2348_c0_g1_i6.p1 TRINITY_DN2348_c0_g1~~TRINITY_DN2348_c0_g1_i6.p1  ORF type:complete len:172 (+),score=24.30 TRINITY_DN2348_c0_g1_i6:276-791(+)